MEPINTALHRHDPAAYEELFKDLQKHRKTKSKSKTRVRCQQWLGKKKNKLRNKLAHILLRDDEYVQLVRYTAPNLPPQVRDTTNLCYQENYQARKQKPSAKTKKGQSQKPISPVSSVTRPIESWCLRMRKPTPSGGEVELLAWVYIPGRIKDPRWVLDGLAFLDGHSHVELGGGYVLYPHNATEVTSIDVSSTEGSSFEGSVTEAANSEVASTHATSIDIQG